MQVIHLQCPSCGNNLEVEDGLETFFCQYCGHRIVLSGQSEHVIKAKVDIENMKHEERLRKIEIENEQVKRSETMKMTKYLAIFFIVFFIMAMIIGIRGMKGGFK